MRTAAKSLRTPADRMWSRVVKVFSKGSSTPQTIADSAPPPQAERPTLAPNTPPAPGPAPSSEKATPLNPPSVSRAPTAQNTQQPPLPTPSIAPAPTPRAVLIPAQAADEDNSKTLAAQWAAARNRPLARSEITHLHEAEPSPQIILRPERETAVRPASAPLNPAPPPKDHAPTVTTSAADAGWSKHTTPSSGQLTTIEHTTRSRDDGRFAMLHTVAGQWSAAFSQCRYLVVVGSSAEARRLAPVIRALREQPEGNETVLVCAAGDRPERTREALGLFSIAVDMEINAPAQPESLEEARTRMITGFGRLLKDLKPQWVVVQGDSVTTAMASIAAYYAQVRVAHVDGGAMHDAHDRDDASPEALHRQIASLFASVHFAETSLSKENLVREGVPEECILVTGNTRVDAVQETCISLGLSISSAPPRSSGVVRVLIAVESAETIAHRLPELCRAVRNLAMSVPGLYEFVWPLPADAQSSKMVGELLHRTPGVLLSGPDSYPQFLRHLSECDLVLTDMEDIQEEAPSLGKPVLLMKDSTDRPEALRAGITTLVAADAASIQAGVRSLARKLSVRHGSITNPYGDGKAAVRILDFFAGRQVLEFGRTALPKLLATGEPPPQRLLPQPSQSS